LKFDREIATYYKLHDRHIQLGRWLIKAEFPEVFVIFGTPNLRPPGVLFGAQIDFTNYDFWPPSVWVVNPFTREPYKMREIAQPAAVSPTIARCARPSGGLCPGESQGLQLNNLLVAADPDEVPFLCLPGVREYHRHPAHTGDSWFLHRGGTEGTLNWILEQLWVYGVQPIDSYNLQIANLQFAIAGFGQSQVPA